MDMDIKPTTLIDFYKSGHPDMLPEGTTKVYNNFTPRSGKHFPVKGAKEVLWYGPQGIIKWLIVDYWNKNFFERSLEEVVGHYKRRMDGALGEGAVKMERMTALHTLGYLPLRIKSLPEGTLVPFGVPTMTFTNTHDDFAWLVGHFEDMTSCEVWPVVTSTTMSYEMRKVIDEFAKLTGTPKTIADWQVHCFAFRGMRGIHDAAQSLSGHLLTSYGTDTVPVLDYLENFYLGLETFLGGSVPATEHMVMCMNISLEMKRLKRANPSWSYDELWLEAEYLVFLRLISVKYPTGIISVVSDTKNLWDVLTKISPRLKEVILGRVKNTLGFAKVVFRPDSGNPEDILCGSARVHNVDEAGSDLEDAKGWALELLVNEVGNSTAHGECGPSSAEGYFSFEGKIYKAIVEIFWNRHDKQFYFIDGSEIKSFEETTLTPEQKGAVQCLWEIFGGTTTDTGHKLLDEHVGLIYGDAITNPRARAILTRLAEMGFASGCVFFGRGSYEAVYATRDSTGSAIKATYGEADGEELELFKDPVTDDGTKRSLKGLLRVERENNTYVVYDQQTKEQEASGALEVVFEDGKVPPPVGVAELRVRVGQLVA